LSSSEDAPAGVGGKLAGARASPRNMELVGSPNAAETKLEVLQELENSGLKVSRPCSNREHSKTGGLAATEEKRSGAAAQGMCRRPSPSSEEKAACLELAELEKCGLRVKWSG